MHLAADMRITHFISLALPIAFNVGIGVLLNSEMALATVVRESTPQFAIQLIADQQGAPKSDSLQAYYKLYPEAPVSALALREHGPAILEGAKDTQLFVMKTAFAAPATLATKLVQPEFWDFLNLTTIMTGVKFENIMGPGQATIHYPTRENFMNMLPDFMICELRQRLIFPGDELTQLWTESHFSTQITKSAQESNGLSGAQTAPAMPSAAILQDCNDFNMMFLFSTQIIFFIAEKDHTLVLSTSEYFVKKETVDKINWIPFVRAESKIGSSILNELEVMKTNMTATMKAQ